jgi:hypothetical protein
VYLRPIDDGVFQSYVPGQDYYGDAALRDCGLNGDFQNARHLVGIGDELAVVAALREEMFGIRPLKVSTTNFPRRNVCAMARTGTRLR